MFEISKHRLVGVPFKASPNISGYMEPEVAVMHYTAGYTASSAINTLTSRRAKVSAHVVIDVDGSITQLVPFNRIAWHAGKSAFNDKRGVNKFSIGFEFVNPGYWKLNKEGDGYIDAYGKKVTPRQLARFPASVHVPNKKIGSGTYIWPSYSEAQIDAGIELLEALVEEYPHLKHVTSHEEIDLRGWKTDPGPAFPMEEFESVVNRPGGRDTDRSDGFSPRRDTLYVTASYLNVRKTPSKSAPRIGLLPKYTEVIEVSSLKGWSFVQWAPGPDKQGWVANRYLTKNPYQ